MDSAFAIRSWTFAKAFSGPRKEAWPVSGVLAIGDNPFVREFGNAAWCRLSLPEHIRAGVGIASLFEGRAKRGGGLVETDWKGPAVFKVAADPAWEGLRDGLISVCNERIGVVEVMRYIPVVSFGAVQIPQGF